MTMKVEHTHYHYFPQMRIMFTPMLGPVMGPMMAMALMAKELKEDVDNNR